MTFVVTEACIKCKYTDCVEVCPVDCFHEGPNMLVIDPEECIDCTLCEPECPVEAIVSEDDVPAGQEQLTKLNAELSKNWPVITGQFLDSSAFSFVSCSCPAGTSSSETIASTGHSGSHSVQSMHSSGSITSMFGPSWKQSTGHTSTQSVYLHLIQASVTTKVIAYTRSVDSKVRNFATKRWQGPRPGDLVARPGGAQICSSATRSTSPSRAGVSTIWQLSRLVASRSSTHSSIPLSCESGGGSFAAQAGST